MPIYRKQRTILLISLLMLVSGCSHPVLSSPSSPTLSKLGGNMQDEMTEALAQSGYLNTPHVPNLIGKNE